MSKRKMHIIFGWSLYKQYRYQDILAPTCYEIGWNENE